MFGAVLLAGVVIIAQPHWLIRMLASRSPDVLYFVETTEPILALTIDDGPDLQTTPDILKVLDRFDARATFFLIGERVLGNEAVVRKIVAGGHELGNHMTRDEPSIDLSPADFERALLETDDLLSSFGSVMWMRPGAGWYNDLMLSVIKAHGYRPALGSIYPYDAEIPSTRFAVHHILAKVRPGSIIVLHDGGARGERTAAVLGRVLPELDRRGFRVVTLSELVDAVAAKGAAQGELALIEAGGGPIL